MFVSVLAAHATEPLVVAYWEGFRPPHDVELVVYDDGTVIGSNHVHCSARRTAWPTDFLVGQLAPMAVDALTDSLERALAGHDDEVVGGTSNCIDGCCSERLVLLTFVDGARRRFVCGTGCEAPWFLEALTALGEAQAVARAPYRAPEVALRVMPVTDSLRRTKDVPALDLGWVACDGAWCATRPRAWYDESFPEPCGRWSSETMRMTSRRWCGLVRVGGALGTMYATDLLPGHERWGE